MVWPLNGLNKIKLGENEVKITFDLEDFWLEAEDGSLEDALRDHITRSVVFEIRNSIKDKINTEITKVVLAQVQESLVDTIEEQLGECIETGVINHHGNDIKITDHVKKMFEDNNSWHSPDKKLQSLAKDFAIDFKSQYNAVFANKIVQNMKEQGLLKSEVVQILLEGKS